MCETCNNATEGIASDFSTDLCYPIEDALVSLDDIIDELNNGKF